MASTSDRKKKLGDKNDDPGENCLEGSEDRVTMNKACTHCRSIKHDNRGCWKGLMCHMCGYKRHPFDKSMHVCAACGEIHDGIKCPADEFYNFIHN